MPPRLFYGSSTFPGLSWRNGGHSEAQRIVSFVKWPEKHCLFPLKLAKGGFVHTGHGDEIRCCFCHFTRCGWLQGEKPEELHRNSSPDCPVFDNGDHNPFAGPSNVPIPVASIRNHSSIFADPFRSFLETSGFAGAQQTVDDNDDDDVVDLHDQRLLQNIGVVIRNANRRNPRGQLLQSVGVNLRHNDAHHLHPIRAAGVPVLNAADGKAIVPFTASCRVCKEPCYPWYSSRETRHRSFANQFIDHVVPVKRLVRLGFFSAGW